MTCDPTRTIPATSVIPPASPSRPGSLSRPGSTARPGSLSRLTRSSRQAHLSTRRMLAAATASLLVALALAGCSSSASTTPAPASPVPSASTGSVAALPAEVSVQEASAMRDAGAFMLDVREPDEWAAGHIPGATLIPLGQLASRASEVPSDREVVVVCRSGNRSAQGRDILLGAGFVSVASMAGGMNDWTAAGLPTEQGS